MSCNGCRVLRKGCSETCMLRSCLKWIDCPNAQGHATLFLAKFFGRSDLMSFISSVPENKRSALFQSLLFEACGRTVNPVNGALGLLWSGNWHVCQAAMETVLTGGVLRPLPNIPTGAEVPVQDESSPSVYLDGCDLRSVFSSQSKLLTHDLPVGGTKQASQNISLVSDFVKKFSVGGGKPSRCPTLKRRRDLTTSFGSEQEAERTGFLLYGSPGNDHKKLLNLFV